MNEYIKLSKCLVARWSKVKCFKRIGGRGETVQVDETKIGWRKFDQGRFEKGVWIFGGMEEGSKRAFMVAVKDRSFETLSRAIKKRIKPSTRILSDCWKGYWRLNELGYCHPTVNHSRGFGIWKVLSPNMVLTWTTSTGRSPNTSSTGNLLIKSDWKLSLRSWEAQQHNFGKIKSKKKQGNPYINSISNFINCLEWLIPDSLAAKVVA